VSKLALPTRLRTRRSLGLGAIPGANGGGGGGYIAKAVHFDGSSYFVSDNLVTADSPLGLFSVWFNDDLYSWETFNGGFFAIRLDLNVINCDFWDTTNSVHFNFEYVPTEPLPEAWGNVVIAVDTNHPAGEKIGQIVINGDYKTVNVVSDTASAFDIGWSQDNTTTAFAEDASTTDAADSYAAMGQFLDLSNSSNVEKFIIGGKPVYLGANGELPTGTSPTVFFSGDADTFGTNLGTGGTFTLTGALTNATTSPSG